ncbi:hypothetical protein SDC9_96905 [bioreactor metagenome]|uniref:Uncharacterized protein n=1 Tax=bioreactor metagenome TaxID=1076179 RepID=A0A645AAC7_9ZZZZ
MKRSKRGVFLFCRVLGGLFRFQRHLRQFTLACFVGKEVVAIDHKAVKAELGYEVDDHGTEQDDILVPSRAGKRFAPPRGERRKHEVIADYLHHRQRDVLCGLKRKLPVYGEVVEHRKRQRDQIARPVVPMDRFVQQGKRRKLNYARRTGEQQKL